MILETRDDVLERIYLIRGRKVMLDQDLALLYGVETKRVNEQVKRNLERFPEDFMFQLTDIEWDNLRSQFATSRTNPGWGGRRKLPYAFTEHGTVMLASVLNSPQAVKANLFVVRAFVRLREVLLSHKEIKDKIEELELRYDKNFKVIYEAIQQLAASKENEPRRKVGFKS